MSDFQKVKRKFRIIYFAMTGCSFVFFFIFWMLSNVDITKTAAIFFMALNLPLSIVLALPLDVLWLIKGEHNMLIHSVEALKVNNPPPGVISPTMMIIWAVIVGYFQWVVCGSYVVVACIRIAKYLFGKRSA